MGININMGKKESEPMTSKRLLELIVTLVLLLILAIVICGLIQQFVITQIRVSGLSMSPTIRESGDKVFVYRLAKKYKIGDVVVFYKYESGSNNLREDIELNDESKNPSSKKTTFTDFLRALPIIGVKINTTEESPEMDNPSGHYKAIIKRIVACPGDTVEFVNGELYVNGERETRFSWNFVSVGVGNNYKHTMERDEYFVMGDNRGNSTDSEDYGPIKASMIYGKAVLLKTDGKLKTDF